MTDDHTHAVQYAADSELIAQLCAALAAEQKMRAQDAAELAIVRVELVAALSERDAVLAAHGELVVAATQLRNAVGEAAEMIAKLQAALLERSARGEA